MGFHVRSFQSVAHWSIVSKHKKFMRMRDKSLEGHTYSFKFYCKTSTFSAHVPRLGAIGRMDVHCSKDAHTLYGKWVAHGLFHASPLTSSPWRMLLHRRQWLAAICVDQRLWERSLDLSQHTGSASQEKFLSKKECIYFSSHWLIYAVGSQSLFSPESNFIFKMTDQKRGILNCRGELPIAREGTEQPSSPGPGIHGHGVSRQSDSVVGRRWTRGKARFLPPAAPVPVLRPRPCILGLSPACSGQ